MPFKLHDDIGQDFLEDPRISWKARGIIVTLLLLPGQSATLKELVSKSRDGIDSVRSGLEELVKYDYGYFYRNHGKGARIVKGLPVKRPGYIYVAQREWDNRYKIGQAVNLDSRLGELIREHEAIRLIWAAKTDDTNTLEGKLHGLFTDKHIDNEWFKLDLKDIKRIRENEGLGAQDG